MNKNKIDKRCCGKILLKGDNAFNHYGVLMCVDCDNKNPGMFMAVYQGGKLVNNDHYCGEFINKGVK